jgi:histidine triad (HIT) family protein
MSFELPSEERCPFCDYLSGAAPCAFITRSALVSAFLNVAQFERGATLLVPNKHVTSLLDLDAELMTALYKEAQRVAIGMVHAFGALGLNMFQNNGVRAGQSVSHYHVHLIPRYETSNPRQLFRAAEFPRTPVEALQEIADELRAALPTAVRI